MRDLEQRDVLDSRVDVVAPPTGRTAASCAGRVEAPRAARAGRARRGCGIVGLSEYVYASAEAAADERRPRRGARRRCSRVSRPEELFARRQRRRHLARGRKRATSSTRSISRAHVARASTARRQFHCCIDVEAEADRGARAGRPPRSDADDLLGARRDEAGSRPLREVRLARRRGRSSARRRARRAVASRSSPPARRARARRPSPSGSAHSSACAGARRCAGRRAARSSRPRAARSSSSADDLALLAAHDPGDRDGPLGVGDHESSSDVEPALGPVERADRPRPRARGGRRSGRRRAWRGRTRAAGCRARA